MKLREWLQQYNLQLNQSQLSAMLDEHPSSLLLAVPGSGKTTLILAKCAYLITKGIPANQILVITFSKEGANELKQRFLSTYRNLSSPNFRTIHSLCYLILKQYNPTGIFTLHQNLRPLLRQLYIKHYQQFPQEVDLNEVQRLITYIRNKHLSEEEMQTINFNNQPFKPFYDTYQQIKISKKIMDFDDLLYYAYHALLKKSDLLKSFRSQIQWLMVDEAQDTSIYSITLSNYCTIKTIFLWSVMKIKAFIAFELLNLKLCWILKKPIPMLLNLKDGKQLSKSYIHITRSNANHPNQYSTI